MLTILLRPDEPRPDENTVLAFSRVTPEMVERLQQDFDVIAPNPENGDINAQFNEALPHAHGLIGVGRKPRSRPTGERRETGSGVQRFGRLRQL